MRRSTALLALAAFAPAARAQNTTFLTGLLNAIQGAGLTQLATVAASLNSTPVGQQVLANISDGGPFILFAPNNAAWQTAPSNVTGSPSVLADVFAYHVVPGNFSQASSTYPNVTLGQSLYDDPLTVHLEGGKPQVVAWAVRADGKTHVLNQRNDSTVVNTTSFGNLTLFVVDHVLQVPESLDVTVPANNGSLASFETVLKSATLGFFNASTNSTGDVTFFDALNEGFRGYTLFSPNNTALTAAGANLSSVAGNRSALNAVLFNHIINGTTLYSPLLAGSQNYTSASGEPLSFSINATGQYVTSGNITARIVQPDVLLPNGVVHIIDTVLFNTESNAGAASSALSSAASAATASHASQSAPVGFSQTQSLSPTGSGNSSGSGGSGSSGAVSIGREKVFGVVAALGGVLVGGIMTLF